MTTSNNAFLISQLRAKSAHKTMEAMAVFVMIFFVLALLPQILVRYAYAGQQLLEEPQLFQIMPVAGFLIGVGYYLFIVVSNFQREMEAKRLEKVMMADSWAPTSTNDSVSALQEAMADLEGSTTVRAPKARRGRPSRRRV